MESEGVENGHPTRLRRLRAHPVFGAPIRFAFRRREQLLYLVVGGWNALFGYALWALAQYFLGGVIPYLVVLVLVWPFAVLNAYIGYRYLVFRSRAPIRRELPRFSVVYVGTLAATLVLLPIALALLPFDIYEVQALLLAVVVVCSYLAHRHFSFGSRRPPAAGSALEPQPAIASPELGETWRS